jgi:hypothetical protein
VLTPQGVPRTQGANHHALMAEPGCCTEVTSRRENRFSLQKQFS